MIKYKVDILEELAKKGYNTTRIRNEKIIPQQTLQNIRNQKPITLTTLNTICEILKKQPGQILEWIPDEKDK